MAIKTSTVNALVCNSEIKIFIETLNEGVYSDNFIVIGAVEYYNIKWILKRNRITNWFTKIRISVNQHPQTPKNLMNKDIIKLNFNA